MGHIMNLKHCFQNAQGIGILATADGNQPVTDLNLAAKYFVCFRVENIRPLVGDSH